MPASDFPTLSDRRMTDMISEIEPPKQYATNSPNAFCPTRAYGSTRIEWDVAQDISGVLEATDRDSDIPESPKGTYGKISFDAPVWRRKFAIVESELTDLRQPGQKEGRVDSEFLVKDTLNAGVRYISRSKEFAAWKALSGTLNIKNATGGGTTTIDYKMPSFYKPTAGTNWSDTANANPLADILVWKSILQDRGVTPGRFVMGNKVHDYLLNNEAVRAVLAPVFGEQFFSTGRLPSEAIGGIPYDVVNGVYPLNTTLATAYSSGTTITVADATEIVAGDRLEITNTTIGGNDTVVVEVASISGSVVTLTGSIGSMSFDVGSFISFSRKFLPDNAFVILPENDGVKWCEFLVAPSPLAGGGAREYVYSERLPSLPFKYEIVTGIDGAPVIFRQGRHIYATVA